MTRTNPTESQILSRIFWLNLIVAVAKLGIGGVSGAVAILADGVHSLIDALANLIGLVAAKIAAQPPDEDHPYGHGRFESIATFLIGGFLMLAAWEVLQAAVGRLLSGGAPQIGPPAFGVLLATLVVNVVVVLYERAQAARLGSRILAADAQHTLTDVLVTLSVLASLALVELGWLWADGVAALLIVAVIGRMGWRIINESLAGLVDLAPLSPQAIMETVEQLPQVAAVKQVRSRGVGGDVHVDLTVQVKPELTAEHAHNIRHAIQETVRADFPAIAEVLVTFAPGKGHQPDYLLRARAAADALGFGVHEVVAIPHDGGIRLEMHVEVPRGLSLNTAHEQVTLFERKLLADGDIISILTHIEPTDAHGAPLSQSGVALQLRDDALTVANTLYPDANWHESAIRLALGGYALTMHCHLPGSISVEEAHHISEQVETKIRASFPQIQRVTIHTEPQDAHPSN